MDASVDGLSDHVKSLPREVPANAAPPQLSSGATEIDLYAQNAADSDKR